LKQDVEPSIACSARAATYSLINDILDLSKIEAGRMELNLETFALPPLIDDVVKTIEPLAKKNGNQVAVHWTPRSGSRSRSYAKFVSQLLHNRSAAGCAASCVCKPCVMRIVLADFVLPQHHRLCTPVAQASTDCFSYSRSRKKLCVREFLGSASSLPHCIAFD
jgi:hypothetical protein